MHAGPEFAIDRRQALGLALGASAIAMGGCNPSRAGAADVPDGAAYAPWRQWNDPALRGSPLALVSAAILAANPHDTQPWAFEVTDGGIEVFADLSRNLGAMDAYVREMYLGLGCAIENALIAATPNGLSASVRLAPGSLVELTQRAGQVPVATIELSRQDGLAGDPLYAAIPRRHTNRGPYRRDKAVPQAWLKAAGGLQQDGQARIVFGTEPHARAAFAAAVSEATQAIIADGPMIADSDRWFRGSPGQIELHRDGPSLETAGLSPITLALARIAPLPPSLNHAAWLRQTRETQLATAPVFGLIAVRDRYDRQSSIAAGRAWQRLHLSAVAAGLAMQPLNQPIEMIDRERQLGSGNDWARRMTEAVGDDGQATFAFRVGYPAQRAPASARRPLRAVVA
jgi:hypothetical protein